MLAEVNWRRIERIAVVALIVGFLLRDVLLLQLVLNNQPLGIDFLPLWTGARVDPARLYDFEYVTGRQAWLYVGQLRPFVYPPSALPLFKPFGLMSFWAAYPIFVGLSGALYVWAARRMGADWRLALIPTPVFLVALAGQLTFLIGGLVMAAWTLRSRAILAGVLFGLAGAIKPQMLVLLPLALLFDGAWRTIFATGATAVLVAVLALPFGGGWGDWITALPRFTALIASDVGLSGTTLTPFVQWGPASLLVTIPAAVAGVWLAARTDSAAQRVLALLGGALLVSPYAVNYEIALLIPAVLVLGGMRLWTLPFWLSLMFFPHGPAPLIAAMGVLFASFVWPDLTAGGRTDAPST